MSKAVEGVAGKTGFCDAIFNRPPQSQFSGHYDRLKYEAGYKAGKESGVTFFAAESPPAAPVEKRKGWIIGLHGLGR
jgi:hypothetical protein